MKKLENKIVFITGGNLRIGRASAIEAAKEGTSVVIADLAGYNHELTINEVIAYGGKCFFVPIHVPNVNSVKNAIGIHTASFFPVLFS